MNADMTSAESMVPQRLGGSSRDLFAGYHQMAPGAATPSLENGRCKLQLKPCWDGSAPTDIDVISWAKYFPVGSPLVTDTNPYEHQLRYLFSQPTGAATSGKPYAILIKLPRGQQKGNITVFLRTRLVQVNCSSTEKVRQYFLNKVAAWTTVTPC